MNWDGKGMGAIPMVSGYPVRCKIPTLEARKILIISENLLLWRKTDFASPRYCYIWNLDSGRNMPPWKEILWKSNILLLFGWKWLIIGSIFLRASRYRPVPLPEWGSEWAGSGFQDLTRRTPYIGSTYFLFNTFAFLLTYLRATCRTSLNVRRVHVRVHVSGSLITYYIY